MRPGPDQAGLTEALLGIRDVVDKVTDAFLDVERWCDHYVFYHRIRPFLTGWSAPGLRFEGVDREPLVLAGGSAAQSSLIQAFDAGLDIPHPHGMTAGFLTGSPGATTSTLPWNSPCPPPEFMPRPSV
ncbi:hypothetical protein [Streptomyces capitiformicae]|uniref:Uncharacterized protein n=1 Tax=Streptomyces capitiformicae TaxID=2014920 RepID=A0A918Z915_9ACTN|nr:hypothetical protein [Streptomyces capitiformicae]GHE41981.1 hypothetical protein GCM10017771_61480 [Streptomyces capitiformicae]